MLSHSVVRAVCGAGERRERDEREMRERERDEREIGADINTAVSLVTV